MVSPSLFPCPRETRPSRPSAGRFHPASLFLLRRLFRAPSRQLCPTLSGGASCQGLVPRYDITRTRPPVARAPRASLRSVLRRSQPLDGLLRARAPRLVSSSSRVQGLSAVQGLLPPRSAALSSSVASPLPLATGRSAGPFDPPSTSGGLGFEASFHAKARSHRLGVEPDRWPLPSSGCFSSRCPALRMGPRVPRYPPLVTLSSTGLRLRVRPLPARLQRLASEALGVSVSRHADLHESFWPDDRNQWCRFPENQSQDFTEVCSSSCPVDHSSVLPSPCFSFHRSLENFSTRPAAHLLNQQPFADRKSVV